ncbi:hypothetical protein DFA_02567 [Cavenderia fasciculata]|uniref:Uncharacterized protein n=1 Tax=Cavenderia fasciculata TaxID=261658 RepID=F4PZR4_CACFS|nr:uncharacterized protein DFA_02567 [Cavenderia fasciculata]EGG18828.1 hypothetical protein DFA_02567 [Cavenderia fasciculata]|eukprot:XP_004357290.1 hypothetical protein DFA_02567 [Cavenderia fasciculata]
MCQELDIDASINQTKDTIAKNIVKTLNDRLAFKDKMVDNNPLCDYNKGTLDDRLVDTLKSQTNTIGFIPFDHYQMWPVYQPLLDEHKKSRMKCPMHTYHHLNGLEPSINIAAPFTSNLTNDLNKWRYQQLGISKRVNQYLSSKYFTNVRFAIDPDTWERLGSPYCPIKALKQLTIIGHEDYENQANHNMSMFSSVEKLAISERLYVSQSYLKTLQSVFYNTKSLTLSKYCMFRVQALSKFKNLTSLTLTHPLENTTRQQLLDSLERGGIVKILLPSEWCDEPVTLDTDLANTIEVSNIHPQLQMPNLHTFHIPTFSFPPAWYNIPSFDHPNVKKIVQLHNDRTMPTSIAQLLPPTVEILKLCSKQSEIAQDVNAIIKTNYFDGLNVNKINIDCHVEILDQTINKLKKKVIDELDQVIAYRAWRLENGNMEATKANIEKVDNQGLDLSEEKEKSKDEGPPKPILEYTPTLTTPFIEIVRERFTHLGDPSKYSLVNLSKVIIYDYDKESTPAGFDSPTTTTTTTTNNNNNNQNINNQQNVGSPSIVSDSDSGEMFFTPPVSRKQD